MSIIILIYLICFAATLGAAFAFMWRSMDLVFREIDKPSRKIHPELKDVKPGEELLVFKVEED
jgi:flagellar basal body-associated protein FliL|tara:strand:+ start:339 stop:527 length:189 start_codon:yes stop_codon:yes gene_type:complete